MSIERVIFPMILSKSEQSFHIQSTVHHAMQAEKVPAIALTSRSVHHRTLLLVAMMG